MPIATADRFRPVSVEQDVDDEVPTSASENRAYGAKKIGSGRCSDFFNRIPHKADIHLRDTHDRLDHRRWIEVEVWRL
jgi:hypothetical protein